MTYNLHTSNTVIYTSDITGAKVYMEVTRDSSSFFKQAGFMVYIPDVGFSKRFAIPFRTLVGKAPADTFLNLGFTREEVDAIADAMRNKIADMKVIDSGESVSIEMAHKLLTFEALKSGYMKDINGTNYCAVPTKDFKKIVQSLDLGYRSHLEILQNFRMLGILFHNANRLDYRKKDFESHYCFIPAEGVKADSDLWGEGTESTLLTTDSIEENDTATQEVNDAA